MNNSVEVKAVEKWRNGRVKIGPLKNKHHFILCGEE